MLETFVIFLLFSFWNFVNDSLKCIVLEWSCACFVTSRSPKSCFIVAWVKFLSYFCYI